MAHADKEFVDYLIDQIGDTLITRRAMFGAQGLYHDQIFFGIVDDGVLYLKTNDRTRERYLKEVMKPLRATKELVLTKYFEVPEHIVDDRETLHEWAQESWRIAGLEKF